MRVEVLLFAQLKEACGSERFFVEVARDTKIADVVSRIMNEKSLRSFSSFPLRFAVNEEFQPEDARLNPNDRLALLSPVAGG